MWAIIYESKNIFGHRLLAYLKSISCFHLNNEFLAKLTLISKSTNFMKKFSTFSPMFGGICRQNCLGDVDFQSCLGV